MRMNIGILLALLCVQLACAVDEGWGGTAGFESWWEGENWRAFALVAVLICIGFNTLVYMLGEAFHLENMKRWAKAEFLQVSASALMILLAVELLLGAVEYAQGEIIGEGSTLLCMGQERTIYQMGGPIEAVKCKLQENIYNLDNTYERIYRNNLGSERATSACTMLFGTNIYCGDWNAALHQEVERKHLLGEKIVPLQVALHGQYALAMYIAQNMLSIFLPLGILMRIFPLTRGVGGLFIAIAIGFYFVFPIMFVLLDPTFVKVEGRPGAIMDDPDACFPGFKGSTVLINSIGNMDFQYEAVSDAATAETLAKLTVKIMFYPFVALAVALVFIRASAPLLGGDTGEIMRMVAKLT